MTEPVYDYYATWIVQDLEDDLYESKERIQRLRRQNDELTAENERLRGDIAATRDRIAGELERIGPELRAASITLYTEREHFIAFCDHLLEGDTE